MAQKILLTVYRTPVLHPFFLEWSDKLKQAPGCIIYLKSPLSIFLSNGPGRLPLNKMKESDHGQLSKIISVPIISASIIDDCCNAIVRLSRTGRATRNRFIFSFWLPNFSRWSSILGYSLIARTIALNFRLVHGHSRRLRVGIGFRREGRQASESLHSELDAFCIQMFRIFKFWTFKFPYQKLSGFVL